MSVLMDNELKVQFDFDYIQVANDVVDTALVMEECPYAAEVNITLVDDDTILELNKEFRDIAKPTDVLSFPMLEFPKPADYDILKGGAELYFHPDSGELLLGDIVISVPTMIRQAQEYEHESKREYAFLIAHSMLHLLGYDHLAEQEAKQMEEKQEKILEQLKITR